MRLLRPDPPALRLRGREPRARSRCARCSRCRSAVVAVVLVGASALHPRPGASGWLLVAALVGAWLINFFAMAIIGSLAFFMESSTRGLRRLAGAASSSSPATSFPLEFLAAHAPRRGTRCRRCPFRYQIGFPVELVLGRHGRRAALRGLGVAVGLRGRGCSRGCACAWRAGVRRFERLRGVERMRRYLRLLGIQLRTSLLAAHAVPLGLRRSTGCHRRCLDRRSALVPLSWSSSRRRESVRRLDLRRGARRRRLVHAAQGACSTARSTRRSSAVVEHIRKGTLDFVLLKPADAQFLVSTARSSRGACSTSPPASASCVLRRSRLLGRAPDARRTSRSPRSCSLARVLVALLALDPGRERGLLGGAARQPRVPLHARSSTFARWPVDRVPRRRCASSSPS